MNEIIQKGKAGLYNISKSFPAIGTIIGGSLVIGSLKQLNKIIKGKRIKI